ncbi:hypothetical protein [Massilia pseudoviolaceinigra]|uniref:hypothetical protein n=1 Tax=Massilia pseudoviolaceinigra TaxID=3057165 RepID=UPI0027965253|nr:hypothetical protein [Massilia sp. CCM 9206]MDQ1920233.1 hypothetical protein [Massilia sp. CCM 9206]
MNLEKIDALISKAAATKREGDYDEFFDSMEGIDVFFNVKPEFPDGSGRMETSTVEVASGSSAVVFFISKKHPKIKAPFAGMPWKKALEMVIKMPDVDGMIVQGGDSAWIGLNKVKMHTLLSKS